MKTIICGAGQVGYGIAERLVAEDIDVTVIDNDAGRIEAIRDTLDVRGLVGYGSHPDMLAAADAADADMLIAVTLYDEINMIACQVAHQQFSVPIKIARIRSQSYFAPGFKSFFSGESLPIDVVISPETEVGDMVLRRLAEPGAVDVITAAEGKVTLLAIECMEDCPLLNAPLRNLSQLFPDLPATIVGIKRGRKIFIPDADGQMQKGDIAYVTVESSQVRRVLSLFGRDEPEARRIIIAGGGNIGLYVARAIERQKRKTTVKIIEADRNRALYIADELEDTPVLNGSVLDQAILQDARVKETDLILTLTNQEQVNVLSAMLAKRLGCKANMVLVNNPLYEELTRSNGIDAHINPRNVTVSKVLQQMRRGRIRAVHSVSHGQAELIEAQALQTSSLVGKPIEEMQLPPNLRIGAIYRDGKIIRPEGETRIIAGDWVIIFALAGAVHDVEQMFRVSLEFF